MLNYQRVPWGIIWDNQEIWKGSFVPLLKTPKKCMCFFWNTWRWKNDGVWITMNNKCHWVSWMDNLGSGENKTPNTLKVADSRMVNHIIDNSLTNLLFYWVCWDFACSQIKRWPVFGPAGRNQQFIIASIVGHNWFEQFLVRMFDGEIPIIAWVWVASTRW
jgi:hypothetical protein